MELPSLLRSAPPAMLLAALVGRTAAAQGWTTAEGETVATDGATATLVSPDDPVARLRELLERHAPADGPAAGLCVRLGGHELFRGATGLADMELGVPATPDTVYDMASLAKSVTGAAIVLLAADDALSLDDPVRTFLPELDAAFDPVRVRHLLHHTAGVEDVDGLLALAGWRPFEPSSFEDERRLLLGLRHLRNAPGTQHFYSNGGYVLLAEIAQRVSGEELADWARATLFEPLGMRSARLAGAPGRPEPALAVAYSGSAGSRRRQPQGASHGAGGLLCSVPDLARWGEELATGAVLGRDFAAHMQTTGTLDDGRALDYAAGISRSELGGHVAYLHSGSLPGGQCTLAAFPDTELVVAVATADGDGRPPFALLREVVSVFLGGPQEPAPRADGALFIPSTQPAPEASRGVEVAPEVLATYAGVYRMSEGPELTVAADGARLLVGLGMDASMEVFPLPGGRFVLPPVNYEFSFDPAAGRATLHVTERSMRRGPVRDITGTRWSPGPATAAERAARVGLYRSDELGAVYSIERDGEGYALVHPRHGRMPLQPLAPDVFLIPGGVLAKLSFRTEGGAVTGFELEARSWNARSSFRRL